LQKYFVPIIDSVRSAFERVSDAVTTNRGNFESVLTLFQTIWDFAQKYFVPILKTQLKAAIEGIGIAFEILFKVASPIVGAIAKLITAIIGAIDSAITKLIGFANQAIDVVNKIIAAYNRIPIAPDIPLIPKLGVTKPSTGSNTITTQIPSITLPSVPKVTGGGTTGGGVTGGGVTGGGTTTTAKVAGAPTILTPSGNAIPATFDVAAARRGEMEQPPIVINVNAPSAIDETGFTRAVQLAIQNTQQRGSGGGGFALIQ
jgi:hypothetical protein